MKYYETVFSLAELVSLTTSYLRRGESLGINLFFWLFFIFLESDVGDILRMRSTSEVMSCWKNIIKIVKIQVTSV